LAQALFQGRALWVSLFLMAVSTAVYAPVWRYDFVAWDDPSYITENPYVSAGLTWRGIRWAFTTGYGANWFPLTWVSHMLDVQLFGLNAGGHHLTNVFLHILNTLLLFGLLHQWNHLRTGALGGSAFVAALFAVHPLHVESVAWVSERKDVLSTLLFLLTLQAYGRYVRHRRRGQYLVVLILFALGLMAKQMLVTLPFILLLLDIWPLGRVSLQTGSADHSGWALWRERRSVVVQLVREKIPLFVLALAFSIVTVIVQRQGGAVAALDAFPLGLRVQNALVSYLAYLGSMLWPARLAAFYPYPKSFPSWLVAGCALVLIVVSAAAIRVIRNHPYFAVGWFWYLGTLVPVIGLVQIGGQAKADRYTYIPLIGLFLVVAWGVPALLSRSKPRLLVLYPAAGIVILACAVAARSQVRQWQTSTTLWERALQVTTGNFTAHTNLGHALLREGRVPEAIAQYTEALQILPDFADAHQGLGVALAGQGKLSEAIPHYREALRLQPGSPEIHNYLGAALAGEGSIDEAVSQYTEALRIQPDFADAHNNLGAALASQGKIDAALEQFLETLRLKPTADVYYNVGTMFEKKGDLQQALRYYRNAIQLDPAHRASRTALDELTAPDGHAVPTTP
jgi:Tfp pilus assembly protein PilF